MHDALFRWKIEVYHKKWLGDALWIPGNGRLGIDLLNNSFAIELKSKMRGYPKQFAVNADQVDSFPAQEEYEGREFYWAFMFYSFSKKVKEIDEKEDLEALVTEREVWCMPWDWIRKFPISRPKKTGPFHYVARHQLPDPSTMTTFEETKGKIYTPQDSDLETYLINRKLSMCEDL